MKRSISSSILLISAVVFLGSCRPKKLIVTAPPVTETVVADKKSDNFKTLAAKQLNYETLVLKGKADLHIDGDENNVTLNVRIKKDNAIWFSVTALGGAIEAARGIITPDSIWIMNRLQKTATKKPFTYIHQFTNPQVNFGWLQAILTGNNIKELMTEKADLKQENGVWVVSGMQSSMAYGVLFNTLLKTTTLTLNDAKAAQGLKVNYDKYTMVNEGLFPSDVKITSAVGNKKISVAVEFVKIEHNVPVEFPFTVPQSFELIR